MADEKELSEDDLFESAVGNESEAADAPAAVQAEPEQAKAPEAETGEVVAEAEKPAVDDNAPMVPSWRVREINEEKRAAQAELETLRAERAQWQRQQQQPREPAKPAEKPAIPDPLLEPEKYAEFVENRAQERYLNERREDSLQRAREANPKDFDEAYAAAQQAIDPALRARMQASRDPGKTLLDWHRENKVKAEVGTDPNAWLEKKVEERLKDPAFLARAVELARTNAQPQTQSNGRPRVELPPSLNGASRSNAALRSAMTADIDDDALFEQTTA